MPVISNHCTGVLNSTPRSAFEVQFFASSACDPSGHGEGERFIGSRRVRTDASGNAAFRFSLRNAAAPGEFITATATDRAGNTSEFSACVR